MKNIKQLQAVSTAFEITLGYAPTHLIQAPGRVNLIGEHTDYNDGFVLPCAIDYQTVIAAAKRDDHVVRVIAVDYDCAQDEFSLTDTIAFDENQMWANYIRGVVTHLRVAGYVFGGADIAVTGNVPQGAGLSSSAALEVVIGQTFKTLYNLVISQQDIALIAQKAENQFVGCNCGIMDQLISAEGQEGHALLIDCRSLETQSVSMPDDLAVVIINTNKKRGLVGSEYNTRREQCEAAAAHFGVKALRDVTIEQFELNLAGLDETVMRRARHVITENARTLNAAKALSSGNIVEMSRLMEESHASMRDDFDITVPEVDALVEIVKAELGELGGVRMTGGGFGGCVVALMPPALVERVLTAVERQYEQQTGLKESVYICSAMAGASAVSMDQASLFQVSKYETSH